LLWKKSSWHANRVLVEYGMTDLRLRIAAWWTSCCWKRWNELTARPREAQTQLLLEIIGRNRSTRFGADHRFDEISSALHYRKQVPIGDYEVFRPYVERAKNGESHSLTREPVILFTLTSGTTAEPKLIPVTRSTGKAHRALTRLWYYRAFVDHPGLLSKKILGIVSPAVEGRTPCGIPFGAASGLIFQSSPGWVKNTFVTPYEVAEIKDFDAKYYVIMRLALEHDVSFFATPNPSSIVRLVETADRQKEEIIKDIRDGTINSRCNLSAGIRCALNVGLVKNPGRAHELEGFAARHQRLRPAEYWPGLRLIGCWKGGTVGVRLKEFERWFAPGTAVRDLGYMASEAQMSLPVSDEGSAGILAITTNYYEFIPEAEIRSSQPVTLTCEELQEGETYYAVLTTPGGLYRYDINDVVRVAGFYKRTPLIEFARKGRDVTSLTGEKLHVNQLIQAMAEAERATDITVRHYRAFADSENSRYAFLVEFETAPPGHKPLARLLAEIDAGLCRLNIEYAQKRDSQRLGAPVLWVMKPHWFERSAHAGMARGARDAQYKAALLTAAAEDPSEVLFAVEDTGAER
jgi:hypothetical protein